MKARILLTSALTVLLALALASPAAAQLTKDQLEQLDFTIDGTWTWATGPFGFSSGDCSAESCNSSGTYGQQCSEAGPKFWICNAATGTFVQIGSGGGGGLTHTVNGLALTSSTAIDFDNALPAAPAGSVNVLWFKDALDPTNVAATPDPTGAYTWTGPHIFGGSNNLVVSDGQLVIGDNTNVTRTLRFDRLAGDGTIAYDGTDFEFNDNINVGTFSILSTGAAISLQPDTGFGVNLLGDGIHLISRDGLSGAATVLRINGDFGTGAALDDARIELRLTDDAGVQYIGARIAWTTDVATAGSEDSRMSFNVASGGASTRVLILGAPSNPASMTLGRNVDENIAFVFDALVGNASLTYQTAGPSFSLSHKLDVEEIERTGSFTIDVNGSGNDVLVNLFSQDGTESFIVRDNMGGFLLNIPSNGLNVMTAADAASGTVTPLKLQVTRSGVGADNDTTRMEFTTEDDLGAAQIFGTINVRATDVTSTTKDSDFRVTLLTDNVTSEQFRITGATGGNLSFGRPTDEARSITFNQAGTDGIISHTVGGGFEFVGGNITQASLVTVKEFSIVGKFDSGSGDRAAFDESDLPSASPAGADFVLGWDAGTGTMERYTVTDVGAGGGSSEWTDNGTDLQPADSLDDWVRLSGGMTPPAIGSLDNASIDFDLDGGASLASDMNVSISGDTITINRSSAGIVTFDFTNSGAGTSVLRADALSTPPSPAPSINLEDSTNDDGDTDFQINIVDNASNDTEANVQVEIAGTMDTWLHLDGLTNTIELGDATNVQSITLFTDGTGDTEIVLPNNSIGDAEMLNVHTVDMTATSLFPRTDTATNARGEMRVPTAADGLFYFDSAERRVPLGDSSGLITDFSNANDLDSAGDVANDSHLHDIDNLTGQSTWATAATKVTNDLTVSGVDIDFEGGASEGFPRLAQSTTPPAAECNEAGESGRIYFDTDALVNEKLFYCLGAGGWERAGGAGGGGFTSFFIDGDNTAPQTISDGDTALFVGGVGIDTVAGVTDQITFNFDATEIVGTTVWGGGASQTWDWNTGTTDPRFVFGDNSLVITNVATLTVPDNSWQNTELEDMATDTLKGRFTAGTGDPEDIATGTITVDATPAAGDFAIGWNAAGDLVKYDIGNFPGGGDGVGYDEVMDEGTGRTKRAQLNFIGAGVSCVDNGGATRTDCTISGGGSPTWDTITAPAGDLTLGHAEFNTVFNWTKDDDTAETSFLMTQNLTAAASTTEQFVLGLQRIDSGGAHADMDGLLLVENLDTDDAVTAGIVVRSEAGLIAVGIDLTDPQITQGINVGSANTPGTPAIAIGGDSGFYEITDNQIRVSLGGVAQWQFTTASITGAFGGNPAFLRETSSLTNPTFVPHKTDDDTGLGADNTDTLSLIAGGTSGMQVLEGDAVAGLTAGDAIWRIPDVATIPTGNPTAALYIYAEGDSLWIRDPSGTATDLAAAGIVADLNDITNVTLTTPADGSVLCFTGTSNDSVNCTVGGELTATEDSGTITYTIGDTVTVTGWTMGASSGTTPAVDDSDTSLATTLFVQNETIAAGEVTGTIGGGLTIADTITVTGWVMGASTANTPPSSDNDTSLATSAFVTSSTTAFTNKTFDAEATGNVLERAQYWNLTAPGAFLERWDGAATASTAVRDGENIFIEMGLGGGEWAEWQYFTLPSDFDNTHDLAYRISFRKAAAGASTDDVCFDVEMCGTASLQAECTLAVSTEVNCANCTAADTNMTQITATGVSASTLAADDVLRLRVTMDETNTACAQDVAANFLGIQVEYGISQ